VTESTAPAVPPTWRAAALEPPRAGGAPSLSGRLRESPDDFRVEERLGFEADGGSAHQLLHVEKTDANTLFVARSLARAAGVRPADVGFAGLKDRRAVALQWFSVPASRPVADWNDFSGPGFRVLEAHGHSRKLRRGALAGNRFVVTVRGLAGEREALAPALERIAQRGVPAYFGAQRFGREGSNLDALAAWAGGAPLPRDREQRSFVLSAARSLLFNAVLAERVHHGTWDTLLQGELVNLDGTGSVFLAEVVDETLRARCAAMDVHPTGPLEGQGGTRPGGEAAQTEAQALAPLASVAALLAGAKVEAARRALRTPVRALDWEVSGDVLKASFELGRGAFATSVLREVLDFGGQPLPGGDD
jgi:tRNA pseudouridine13 synthase